MDLGQLIETHGYWVLALGCLLEGETILALAGFAAHRGYLELHWVLAVAAACGFAGDEFFFWMGRRHGAALLARAPRIAHHAERLHRLIERHHSWVIVSVRFAYGLRIAGPILIGASRVSSWRFAAYNAVGAVIWAVLIAGLGWTLGQAIESVFGEIRRLEAVVIVGVLVLAGAYALIRHVRRRDG
jgi:membrane protein DedA with SNARE-associated domain